MISHSGSPNTSAIINTDLIAQFDLQHWSHDMSFNSIICWPENIQWFSSLPGMAGMPNHGNSEDWVIPSMAQTIGILLFALSPKSQFHQNMYYSHLVRITKGLSMYSRYSNSEWWCIVGGLYTYILIPVLGC